MQALGTDWFLLSERAGRVRQHSQAKGEEAYEELCGDPARPQREPRGQQAQELLSHNSAALTPNRTFK